jgi:hypothetical protein
MLAALIPSFTVSANVTATPSSHTVFVNGNAVPLRAFNIGGHNFFMLRDVAFVMMDTTARFDVFLGQHTQRDFADNGHNV